jgi:hypothetical protein
MEVPRRAQNDRIPDPPSITFLLLVIFDGEEIFLWELLYIVIKPITTFWCSSVLSNQANSPKF